MNQLGILIVTLYILRFTKTTRENLQKKGKDKGELKISEQQKSHPEIEGHQMNDQTEKLIQTESK